MDFNSSWKEAFPEEEVPSLQCLDHNKHSKSSQDQTSDNNDYDSAHEYRKSLQAALDQHTSMIEDLQKKLMQQQFIVEFIAQELEKLPVPRYVNSATLITGNESSNPTLPVKAPKPKPIPRGPPVAKKPNPPPRMSMAIGPTQPSVQGVIKRNKTTPPAHTSERRMLFAEDSSSVRTSGSLDSAFTGEECGGNSEHLPDSNSVHKHTEHSDQRFSTFQGSTFSRRVSGSSPSRQTERKESPSRRLVARDSMKKMQTISFDDDDVNSEASTPVGSDTSDYQALWVTPSAEKGAILLGQTAAGLRENQLQADTEAKFSDYECSSNETSAASMATAVTRSRSKGSNRMVMVDYSQKDNGPQPIRQPGSVDEEEEVDSDLEDDKPQYVRLMYRAYSAAAFVNRRKHDMESVGSSGSDNADGAPVDTVSDNRTSTSYPSDGQELKESKKTADEEKSKSYENWRMRNWVVNSILQSETHYVEDLNVLLRYKDNLEKAAESSQPMISMQDIKLIFGNLDAIFKLHQDLKRQLEPIVAEWSERSEVGDLFIKMAVNLPQYQTYLENYPKAISALKKCCQETASFDELVKEIKCPSTLEPQQLEEILHKPINRMQRNGLVLHDFVKCTPSDHKDYPKLLKALTLNQHFLDNIKITTDKTGKPLRVLVKNQLLVEYVGNQARKLRHVFLFNDVIVCTKYRVIKGKYLYEVKWHVPLDEVILSDKMDDTPVERKRRVDKTEKEITAMNNKVKALKAELRKEMKECKDRQIDIDSNNKVQRLRRKLQEQEGHLILAEPRLRLTIGTKKAMFVFLLPSDYERREWQESIQALINKLPSKVPKISSLDAQNIIDSCKDTVQLNSVGQMVMKEAVDEDIVSGQLTITIHKIQGLQEACDTYTAVDIDSFGHFYLKAKTHLLEKTKTPVWNESFEIDLEAAGTMRLICYKRTSNGDILLGKCALDFNKQWLRQGFHEKELSMNDVTLTISIKYRSAEQTIRRIPSRIDSGLFGVKISHICKREGNPVPVFVTACINEVESRGLTEMGIYRVSGTTTDVQRLRKAFDKNAKAGKTLLSETDINAVTGAFKLYFRELPEALFTDDLYPDLVEGYKIQDKDEKERRMISLLASLPDPNYHTIIAVLNHLVKVCSYEAQNKMPFHNLAVVFGPTLLKPAAKGQPENPMDLFSSGANDAMYQSQILFYYLTLQQKGVQYR